MDLFDMSYNAMVTVLLLFSCVFLVLPVPKGEGMQSFKYSLKFLSICYAIIGLFCVFKHYIPKDLLGLPFFCNATVQAHFLGNTFINMVNPNAVKKRNILILTLPAIIMIIVNIIMIYIYGYSRITEYSDLITYCFSAEKPYVFLRELMTLYYLAICIHYSVCFFIEVSRAKKRIDNYTSEAHYKSLTYLQLSFTLVVAIAMSSIARTFSLSDLASSISNFVILINYIGVGLIFIQYPKNFYYLQEYYINTAVPDETKNVKDEMENWPQWKNKIIDEEIYKRPGLTIIQLAQILCTNRTTLSTSINQNENVNFNSFINNLRINKAKELMSDNKLSLADICFQVGYTDQANFSRTFKNITGTTPLAWRRKLQGTQS